MLHFNIFTAMVDMVLLGAIRILELVLLIETGNFLL